MVVQVVSISVHYQMYQANNQHQLQALEQDLLVELSNNQQLLEALALGSEVCKVVRNWGLVLNPQLVIHKIE